MKKICMFTISLLMAAAVMAAGCGGNGGTTGDADGDLDDTGDTTDTTDVPPDTPLDVPTDTPPDVPLDTPADTDAEGDAPVDPGGCMSNDDCAETEFCEFMTGVCEAPGECAPRGDGDCPAVYAPVCGCDSQTYGNDCMRMYAGVSLWYTGECGAAVCYQGDPTGVCDGDTEFCEGPEGDCSDDTPGWCETRPEGCPEYYSPVCGCDGVTYDNDCFRKAAGIWLAYEGECPLEPCYMGDPTGACDERTEFCEGPEGACSEDTPGWCERRPLGCPDVWDPVCGCDGVTYGNDCERQMAGVWLDYYGICMTIPCYMGDPAGVCASVTEFCEGPPGICSDDAPGWCEARPAACPDVWDPVCGCDGNTYANDCERQLAGVWLYYRGECAAELCYQGDPGGVCPRGEFCEGPEGACELDIPGRCIPIPSACPFLWDPVCGCDGRTYANDCMRQVATVWLDYRGECVTPPPECGRGLPPCPDRHFCEYPPGDCGLDPGSTGVCTYMPDICPFTFDPVCGCDGNTYVNDCFRAAAGVSLLHEGECT